jgi:hypothetical protein
MRALPVANVAVAQHKRRFLQASVFAAARTVVTTVCHVHSPAPVDVLWLFRQAYPGTASAECLGCNQLCSTEEAEGS